MWFLIIQFIERNIIKNPSLDCSLHILQSNYNNRKNIMFTEASVLQCIHCGAHTAQNTKS